MNVPLILTRQHRANLIGYMEETIKYIDGASSRISIEVPDGFRYYVQTVAKTRSAELRQRMESIPVL